MLIGAPDEQFDSGLPRTAAASPRRQVREALAWSTRVGDHWRVPREPGDVDESRAKIKPAGDGGLDALYNFRRGGDHDHVVSNDGINVAFLRESGRIIVDDFRVN